MANHTSRIHVVVPHELLTEVDELVGPRRRSEFVVDALEEKVTRERLRRLAGDMAGSLRDIETPGWETPEAATQWVRALREEDDKGLQILSIR